MEQRIFFYGTIPKKGQVPYGGGEVGNTRTIRMLRNAGYTVTTIRQRKAEANWGRFRAFTTYPVRLLAGWLELFIKLIFSSRKNIVHLSGFAGKTIFNEYILMLIIKILGFKAIYELRGGGAISFWTSGSNCYKRMFRYLIKHASYVFTQGQENIPLINSIADTPAFHYANCVEDGFAPNKYPTKPKDSINILFFGRIEANKHVDMIVDIVSIIQKKIPNVHFTLIGNGKSDYVQFVKGKMLELLLPDSYKYYTGCRHEELPPVLADKHFFIFPSTQPREGQSNSITECMAYGIVPVASPQGFNRSTIGNDSLIIEKLDANLYANRIIEIITNNDIEPLSRFIYQRFCENFTEGIVSSKALSQYQRICKNT